MRAIGHTMVCCAALALLIAGCATSDKEPEAADDKPLAKEEWTRIKMQATVEDIDAEKRELTLRGSQGNLVTLTATENVKRFDEIKVGDSLRVEYLTGIRAEFREPTAEEEARPLVVLAEAGRAPKEVDPAGQVGAIVKAVVTVVAVDTKEKVAVIQGPRGKYLAFPVKDEAVLKNLKVGERLVMTYAEASALSLIPQ